MVKGYLTVMGHSCDIIPNGYDILAVSYFIVGNNVTSIDKGLEQCKGYAEDEVFDLIRELSGESVEQRISDVMQAIVEKFDKAGVTDVYVEDDRAIAAIRGCAKLCQLKEERRNKVDDVLDKYKVHKVMDEYKDIAEYKAVAGIKAEYRLITKGLPMLMGKDLWKMLDGRVMNEGKADEMSKLITEIMEYKEDKTAVSGKEENEETEANKVWAAEMSARRVRFVQNVSKLGERGKAAVSVAVLTAVGAALNVIAK